MFNEYKQFMLKAKRKFIEGNISRKEQEILENIDFTGDKDIYKGSIFIPIIGDLVDAVSATGGLKAGIYDDLRSKYETRNYNKAPQFVKQ